ncbi:hypothetical protein [Anaerotignum sp.]
MNKKTFWRVPVFSLIAGFLCYYSYAPMMSVLGKITEHGLFLAYFPYVVYFVAVLVIGGLVFFRNMTRKEIFLSASILVVIGVMILVAEWVALHQFDRFLEGSMFWTLGNWWSSLIVLLGIRIIPNAWFCSFVACFAPYLFVLFGRRE